jgi:pSer/pThr/pTyr-binding forkhead associated (FHA) protein
VLEHPTASRLHAILQYDGDSKKAFLFDPGSVHGTFLNKRRLKVGVHVPIK